METEHNEQMKDAEQQAGYPDISKANTKFIVIVSLICLAAIFLLSILFPEDENTATDKSSTKTTVTTEAAVDKSSTETTVTTEAAWTVPKTTAISPDGV